MNIPSVNLLLVEDDVVDAEAIVRAFRKHEIPFQFTIVPDGLEAFRVLRGEGQTAALSRPYMILLDINMPRMNGIEFLESLRADPALRRSIVFVLTTSNRLEDKMAAYNNQVAGYLLKSRTGLNFSELVTMLETYWRIVEFPPEVYA